MEAGPSASATEVLVRLPRDLHPSPHSHCILWCQRVQHPALQTRRLSGWFHRGACEARRGHVRPFDVGGRGLYRWRADSCYGVATSLVQNCVCTHSTLSCMLIPCCRSTSAVGEALSLFARQMVNHLHRGKNKTAQALKEKDFKERHRPHIRKVIFH